MQVEPPRRCARVSGARMVDAPSREAAATKMVDYIFNRAPELLQLAWMNFEQHAIDASIRQTAVESDEGARLAAFDVHLEQVNPSDTVIVEQVVESTGGDFERPSAGGVRRAAHTEVARFARARFVLVEG